MKGPRPPSRRRHPLHKSPSTSLDVLGAALMAAVGAGRRRPFPRAAVRLSPHVRRQHVGELGGACSLRPPPVRRRFSRPDPSCLPDDAACETRIGEPRSPGPDRPGRSNGRAWLVHDPLRQCGRPTPFGPRTPLGRVSASTRAARRPGSSRGPRALCLRPARFAPHALQDPPAWAMCQRCAPGGCALHLAPNLARSAWAGFRGCRPPRPPSRRLTGETRKG